MALNMSCDVFGFLDLICARNQTVCGGVNFSIWQNSPDPRR